MKNAHEQISYTELHRNQFHFSPPKAWMNDPNGMVYFDGEYHLFYQYYPDSNVWGPMHWGHAISADLIHWEHLPIALYPDSLGYIFSGSAVIDKDNTAGFGENAMIAIFTHHDPIGEKSGKSDAFQYQSIAYSLDRGRTFTKYDGNPVIANPGIKDFRDPKVIWDDDSDQWVMIFAAYDHVKLYGSANLIEWKHLSDWGKEYGAHGGVWECPDLFPLKVKGTAEKKWVLLQSLNPGGPQGGSGTQYFIGDFDGHEFTLDPEFESMVQNGKVIWLDQGADNYAGVTWSNAPALHERLFIGWMSNWQYAQIAPTENWRSAMTLPRKLTLNKTGKMYKLQTEIIKSFDEICKNFVVEDKLSISTDRSIDISQSNGAMRLRCSVSDIKNHSLNFLFSNMLGENLKVGYDQKKESWYIDRRQSGLTDFEDKFPAIHHSDPIICTENTAVDIILDAASVEVLINQGQVVMTDILFPTEPYSLLKINTDGLSKLDDFSISSVHSIWKERKY